MLIMNCNRLQRVEEDRHGIKIIVGCDFFANCCATYPVGSIRCVKKTISIVEKLMHHITSLQHVVVSRSSFFRCKLRVVKWSQQ